MFGRRLVILVAVLMGLTALAASVAPPPEKTRRDGSPTPVPSAAPTPARTEGSPRVVTAQIEIGPLGASRPRVRARAGDTLMLEVSGDVVDAVVVDDLPVIEPINPDSPARLQIFTDAPGRFPVRLLDHHREIGELEVTPRG